ncbi:hypothetical protein FQN57_002331 [Myotisia sp. PD_48]|nr:hypothetical protein FQN57_002331 [Myotisia sp. PD_48]
MFPAFENNGMMPRAHECTSSPNPDPAQLNESPPFNWTSAPAETKSFAIIMTDISINLLHWIIYDIPPNVLSLPQKVENKYQPAVPLGSRQIYYRGSAQLWGYQGPCSPNSVNSYEFVVYALNKANLTELNENSTIRAGATAIRAASIGSAKTVGKS